MEFLDEVRGRRDKAQAMIKALCKPRNSEGAREWVMTIPVNKERDPDAVIGISLRDIPKLIERITELEKELGDWKDGAEVEADEADIARAEAYRLERELAEAKSWESAWRSEKREKVEARTEVKRLRAVVEAARLLRKDNEHAEWEICDPVWLWDALDALDRAGEADEIRHRQNRSHTNVDNKSQAEQAGWVKKDRDRIT